MYHQQHNHHGRQHSPHHNGGLPNGFDAEIQAATQQPHHPVVQGSSSADTSVSSVATEPHHVNVPAEPSSRRRVISPVVFDAAPSCAAVVNPSAVAAVPAVVPAEPRPKQNNPYMYNVLGANASPDLASRTSPIPPACPLSPTQQHNVSYGDVNAAFEEAPLNNSSNWQLGAGADGARPLPVLGGYMAARYTSAFPPGQLPVLQQQQQHMMMMQQSHPTQASPQASATPQQQRLSPQRVPSPTEVTSPTTGAAAAAGAAGAGSSRRRNSNRRGHPAPLAMSEETSPRSPLSPTPSLASPTSVPPMQTTANTTSPTQSSFKVMYRNGRPVPVPSAMQTAAAPTAAAAVTAQQ